MASRSGTGWKSMLLRNGASVLIASGLGTSCPPALEHRLYPSFLQPSTRYCNGLDTENKLWLCLCSRHVHWQNQLYTRQPMTLQHIVWAQLQLLKHLAWVLSILCCTPAVEDTLTNFVTIRSNLAA